MCKSINEKQAMLSTDLMEGFLVKGGISFLASCPGMGKTTLLLQLLHDLAETTGKKVLLFSLEMLEKQVIHRLEQMGIQDTSAFIICDQPGMGMTIEQMCSVISSNPDVAAVGIDYLQLLGKPTKEGLVRLKRLAGQMDIPVIMTSQLSRTAEDHDNDGRGLLEDVILSEEWKEAGDCIGLLWRKHKCDRGVGFRHAFDFEPQAELAVYLKSDTRYFCTETYHMQFREAGFSFASH